MTNLCKDDFKMKYALCGLAALMLSVTAVWGQAPGDPIPVLLDMGDGVEPSIATDRNHNLVLAAMRNPSGGQGGIYYRLYGNFGGAIGWTNLTFWDLPSAGDPAVACDYDNPDLGKRDFYLGALTNDHIFYQRYYFSASSAALSVSSDDAWGDYTGRSSSAASR